MRAIPFLLCLVLLCASLPAAAQSSNSNGVSRTTRQQYDWDEADAKRERERRLDMEAEKDREIERLKKRLDAQEEEEEPDFHKRTLGRSCMYGADGSVIFRPKGARCKGDPPPAARSRAAAKRKPRASSGKTRSGPQKGRCLYGAGNQVIYAPPGVNCVR